MDLQKWARDALLVQNAVNSSGIVHSLSRFMHELVEAGLDTHARNTHPIVKLFIDKLYDLSFPGSIERGDASYRQALADCERFAKGDAE